ncbi:hypothetical protein DFH11DRAFT_809320 [Phellopilus nigrolimitatus]|nr:hypothetical protein DFH11DRAFT_809320 [Phellopilus nigrolimitatus]
MIPTRSVLQSATKAASRSHRPLRFPSASALSCARPTGARRAFSKSSAIRSTPERHPTGVDAVLHAQSDPAFIPRPTLLQRDFALPGRVAVVSGGNSGPGLEIALALCEAGAIVHCLDRASPGDTWRATREYVARFGLPYARLEYAQVDLTDQQAVWDVVEKIAEMEGGRMDVGVSAAEGREERPGLEYTTEEFARVLDVNVNAAFYTAQAAGRQMYKYDTPGSIILIASESGSLADKGHRSVAYTSSKAALLQVCRSMAGELGEKGIRVNTLSPGSIRTAAALESVDASPDPQEALASLNPLGRLGRPDELRGAAAWLASDASTFCTATDILVTGGHHAW